MAKKEVLTDLWVYELLKEAGIELTPQGSSIKELSDALSTASKSKTGNAGYPEYCGVVKDFVLIIENKASVNDHVKYDDKELIDMEVSSVRNYAVNGALFYGKHLAKNTSYKKFLAFGISGNEKRHKMTPIFINERGIYTVLDDVETFALFSESNIDEYYTRNVLKEDTPEEKTTQEILKDAEILHNDLRNYGSIQDKDKPLVVSGILLALREMEFKGFDIENLIGDELSTDGNKIYRAIESNLNRANVSPQVKKDKLLTQFAVIRDTQIINEINDTLGKTPLRYYTEFLYEKIYKNIKYIQSAEDYLGRFYGEFMSYSGGDGQNLGIVLTPKHITQLFCDLADLKPTDSVLDPCTGTGGFLIASMHNMVQKAESKAQERNIRKNQLHGLELQPYMFTIATTNMILRGDGKSNLEQEDFLRYNPAQLQERSCTVGMMNPPYSMGSKANPSLYEINFTEHLLNSIVQDGKVVIIVPISTMTGKTKEEKAIKENILKYHTLEGVITLNPNTFFGVGTNPCIAVFTAGIPHDKDKLVKFINFENDGFIVQKQKGLVETVEAKDKKQHLLDVWFNKINSDTSFCVKTTVEPDDEWLHAFYYFNDEVPNADGFVSVVADYLSFEFKMIAQGKSYLFPNYIEFADSTFDFTADKEWDVFKIEDIFDVTGTYTTHPSKLITNGDVPRITCSATNNGFEDTYGNPATEQGGVLTVDSATIGYVSYQESDFIATDHVEKLTLKAIPRMNRYLGLFFVWSITSATNGKYGYGYKFAQSRIRRQRILLPVDASGKPDYEYMENYIKHLGTDTLREYIEYKKIQS